jgi:ribosome-binding protein aMBF1 (putative translation factor)
MSNQQEVNPAIEVVQSLQQGEMPKNEQMAKIMNKADDFLEQQKQDATSIQVSQINDMISPLAIWLT